MHFSKMNWPSSLRARLLGVFFVGMALSAGLVAVSVLVLAEPFSKYMLRSGIEDYSEAIARSVRFDAGGKPIGLDETKVDPWIFTAFGREVLLRLLDEHGQVTYASNSELHALAPQGVQFDPGRSRFELVRDGIAMHAATVPLLHAGRHWYLQFAASDRLVLLMRQSIGLPALLKGIVATCATFFVVFLITTHFTLRRALEPLRIASDAAKQITPRTLDARLDVNAQPIEIRPLVDGFNQALGRLQDGFIAQQVFLSSAAHELKTPLALIRAQVELGPADERRQLLLHDVDRMARQVQQLLLLAEVSEQQNFRIESVDPRPTIHEVFEYMGRVAERHSVRLGLRIGDDVHNWRVDRSALFTLLKNLLENAIQHSPVGGVVTLSVSARGFSVVDEGAGVPAEHLPRLFDRFWRGPDRRDQGAGLGLAICLEIALAHGWTLRARCRHRGLEVYAATDSAEHPD